MKFKLMTYFILSILLILFLEQCSIINVLSPPIFKKAAYDTYPYLKEGVVSENYEIRYISSPYKAFITYDSKHNYFFIAQEPYRKIDHNGVEKIKIEFNGQLDNPLFTHYVFDKKGVYDFSKDTVKKENFSKIINADYSMKAKEWNSLFKEYYRKAQVVVYGNDMDYKYYPIYLKINNLWILLLTSSYDGINQDYSTGISFDGYPAKFNKMILLKSAQTKDFSNGLTQLNTKAEEYSLNYPKNFKIKRLFYKKEMVAENFPYTSIPQEYSGTAYYRLKTGGDTLKFKEKALKHCLRISIKTYLNWFVLPKKYIQNTEVSFLELRYPHNINESGSNGLYIVKKKESAKQSN